MCLLSRHLSITEGLKLQAEFGQAVSLCPRDRRDVPEMIYRTVKSWTHDTKIAPKYGELFETLRRIQRQDLAGR